MIMYSSFLPVHTTLFYGDVECFTKSLKTRGVVLAKDSQFSPYNPRAAVDEYKACVCTLTDRRISSLTFHVFSKEDSWLIPTAI